MITVFEMYRDKVITFKLFIFDDLLVNLVTNRENEFLTKLSLESNTTPYR